MIRWKFPFRFIATEPNVDDVIRLEAGINQTASFNFQVSNIFDTYSEFTVRCSHCILVLTIAIRRLTSRLTRRWSSRSRLAAASWSQRALLVRARSLIAFPDFCGSLAEGTQFVANFSPREYTGKPLVGRLVIQTDDMQWTYEVRGSHPRYQAPAAAASSLPSVTPGSQARVRV